MERRIRADKNIINKEYVVLLDTYSIFRGESKWVEQFAILVFPTQY
jgi:hypothetical protein